jgi:hypothetical protein
LDTDHRIWNSQIRFGELDPIVVAKTDLCFSKPIDCPPYTLHPPQFKMSSIKQIIINAIIKVSGENPALNREGEVSAVEARDDFIRALMAELFPEETTVVSVPAESPKKSAVSKEDDVQKAARKVAKVAKTEKDAAKEAAKIAKAAEKAAKADAKKSPAKAPEPVPEVAPAPAAESPTKTVKVPKAPKKVKPAEDANLQKIDPTWRKHLKKADKDGAKESEPLLLAYLNAMTKEEFNATKAEDHVAAFVASRATPPAKETGTVEAGLQIVEFEGKEYFVNPETKRVYEGEGVYNEATCEWSSYKGVGYVGMGAFETMEV